MKPHQVIIKRLQRMFPALKFSAVTLGYDQIVIFFSYEATVSWLMCRPHTSCMDIAAEVLVRAYPRTQIAI